MQKLHFLGLAVSLSMITGVTYTTSAQAQSYSDITGTNIWNNVAPISGDGSQLDPQLAERIDRLNRESAEAYQECNAAITLAEQNTPSTRRYSRQPNNNVAVPIACRQLETLRVEMDDLRFALANQSELTANTDFSTW
ncbi:MAG: hypothetical protein WA865_21400 [Spirulinaceae cyanobacterium]